MRIDREEELLNELFNRLDLDISNCNGFDLRLAKKDIKEYEKNLIHFLVKELIRDRDWFKQNIREYELFEERPITADELADKLYHLYLD